MNILVRNYETEDAEDAAEIWNTVVRDGVAFPQEDELSTEEADAFFKSQSHTGIAYSQESGEIVGLYILHPNNVGRCGHICNASYAVRKDIRGKHVGEILVRDCIEKGGELGFGILQFNAVVATNAPALHLYEKLGFQKLGVIPGGFRMDDGHFEDIIPHYILLNR